MKEGLPGSAATGHPRRRSGGHQRVESGRHPEGAGRSRQPGAAQRNVGRPEVDPEKDLVRAGRIHRLAKDAGRFGTTTGALRWTGHRSSAGGLHGVSRRKQFRTTGRDEAARQAPDLVDRQFTAAGPDRLWVADITYVPTWAGFLFLAVVVDAWSRRVIGWAMATHLRTELILAALDMAVAQRQPTDVIHHSDHGCQYTSVAFGKRCRDCRRPPVDGQRRRCVR
jgi:transposase InsO family protein